MKTARIVLIALIAGCGPSAEEAREEKFAKLEALRLETSANLYRQKAECVAVSIEFPGDKFMADSCLESYRMHLDMAQRTYAMIDVRLAEIRETGR